MYLGIIFIINLQILGRYIYYITLEFYTFSFELCNCSISKKKKKKIQRIYYTNINKKYEKKFYFLKIDCGYKFY